MKKMNKKGFTLIEMLVVIAIIAVLVAIIIPTVSSSTVKAKAAADAANLRSVLSEVTTAYMSSTPTSGKITTANAELTIDATTGKPTAISVLAACPDAKSSETKMTIIYRAATDGFEVNFGGHGINDYAKVAEEGGTVGSTAYAAVTGDVSGTEA